MQEQHAEMLAAVLKLRLRADGKALIALAVRDEVTHLSLQALLDAHPNECNHISQFCEWCLLWTVEVTFIQ